MTTLPEKIVLFDLDDSLHEAEEHLFDYGWNHVLRPWGYLWRKKGDLGEEDLIAVSEDQRPGIGVRPKLVAKHFIRVLGMSLDDIDEERLIKLGFKHHDELMVLKRKGSKLSPEELEAEFTNIIEKERIRYFVEKIRSEGIIPLDGYQIIPQLHEAGIKVGIVTNASLQIATMVLEKLGFIQYEETDGALKIKSILIDVIVSGGMPEEPKPSPAPLEMANFIIRWKSLGNEQRNAIKVRLSDNEALERVRRIHLTPWEQRKTHEGESLTAQEKRDLRRKLFGMFTDKPSAMFGDSGSDVKAASSYGIPIIIVRRSQYSDEQSLRKLGATHIVTSFAEITPLMLLGESSVTLASVEGSPRKLPGLER